MKYAEFLEKKTHLDYEAGFEPAWMPNFLFPFQRSLVDWSLRKGRCAEFADCGLGKTPMQLVWSENVARHAEGRVLILTPLAVSRQTIREGDKFGIEVTRSTEGKPAGRITVTNYERLHLFDPDDYVAVVCDESSAIKHFDGKRRALVTDFLRKRPYRLLCTATAAPNDYTELGTSSEALGVMGYVDMLGRYFKNDLNNVSTGRQWGSASKWRFKKHAETPFWRWVCSWARAMRKPSDLGFDDEGFDLPPLDEREHIISTGKKLPGMLFSRPAVGLAEQREERRLTITERCERVAEMVDGTEPAVVWCQLNDEGDLLERLIPDALQVKGSQSDELKEERLEAFQAGELRVLITKPKIGAFGLNWQHCNRMTFFPSHSYEQYYQGVRRCWRFGQERPVRVDMITTEGEIGVLKNLQRKAAAADAMFSALTAHMRSALSLSTDRSFNEPVEVPSWL